MPFVLVLNAGSSSLKFAVFALTGESTAGLERSGQVRDIGTSEAMLVLREEDNESGFREEKLGSVDHAEALEHVLRCCAGDRPGAPFAAVGHRVVHGGPHFREPTRLDAAVVARLKEMSPYDPAHQPPALRHVETLAERWPELPQVACFDTTFHADLPPVVRLLPIPRSFAERGVRRYGFHGLSYTFLLEELARLEPARGGGSRVVFAHLGSGASLAAVRDGRCIDTTMSFTPTSGLPMSTRSAELDPGVVLWLAREDRMSIDEIFDLANRRSGLLGVSGTSGDLRALLAAEKTDARAAEAVALFCYSVQKTIGAYAAALGGLDTVVFSGGVGEHAAEIRARCCAGLEFLGIEIEPQANATHGPLISRSNARVAVRVIPTNEEVVIARETRRVLQL